MKEFKGINTIVHECNGIYIIVEYNEKLYMADSNFYEINNLNKNDKYRITPYRFKNEFKEIERY